MKPRIKEQVTAAMLEQAVGELEWVKDMIVLNGRSDDNEYALQFIGKRLAELRDLLERYP